MCIRTSTSFENTGTNGRELSVYDMTKGSEAPTLLLRRQQHHLGSIYCVSFSSDGTLLASGSNDKVVRVVSLTKSNVESSDIILAGHNGTCVVVLLCIIPSLLHFFSFDLQLFPSLGD